MSRWGAGPHHGAGKCWDTGKDDCQGIREPFGLQLLGYWCHTIATTTLPRSGPTTDDLNIRVEFAGETYFLESRWDAVNF